MRDWIEDHQDQLKAGVPVVALVALLWWWIADPAVVVGPAPAHGGHALILLHGHGASKTDLQPLAEELARGAPEMTFMMPSGPHRAMMGRTWYPSFTADSQQAVDARMLELRGEARDVALDLIDELQSAGVAPGDIYVGGFSQGATVALDVVMNGAAGANLGGFVSLSGGSLPLELEPLSGLAPQRVFVSHGSRDRVLDAEYSRRLVKALQASGHTVTFVEFEGGHEIAEEARTALAQFLGAAGSRSDATVQ